LRLPHHTLGLALGFVAIVVFGSTLPMTRLALEHFDPWFITASRALGAGLAAAALLVVLRRPVPDRTRWRTLVAIALFAVLGFPAFIALAMQSVPAAHGGVVLGILPLATAVAAALLNNERPSLMFWLFAAAGSALVVVFALREGTGGYHLGDLYLVGATVSAAVGYTLSGRLTRTMPGWEVISWALIIALPFSAIATWLLWGPDAGAVPVEAWLYVGFLGLFPQYVGFFAWNAGMAMSGVARVGQMQLLQTFVTLAFAAILLGERIDAATLLFATAVVATVALGSRTRVNSSLATPLPRETKSG
jgi:drug/metabolite transporter (DMT)-like permease